MKQNLFIIYLIMVFAASSNRCFAQDDQPVVAAAAAQPAASGTVRGSYSSGQPAAGRGPPFICLKETT
jgi:hypothetical protein